VSRFRFRHRAGRGADQNGDDPIAHFTPPADGPEASQRRWLLRIWTLVVLFAVITLVRSHQLGIPLRDPHGAILRNRLLITAGLLVVLALVDAVARTPRASRRRPRAVVGVLRARWPRRRLVVVTSGLLAYHLVYFCYHNLKSWVAFRPLRDDLLWQWDRWLFLGHTPAVVLHDLLGQHLAAYVLMVFYESFTTLVSVSLVASVVFVERIEQGFLFVTSGLWAWILGVGSYYLLPSIGPFHHAPGDFAGLPHTLIQDTQAQYLAQRTHLLADPHAHDAFAQLGAFASLHVAMTTLVLLMARHYGLRRTARAMTVFVGVTMVATVYLGWHYVVDDLAGIAIALLAVALGRATIGQRTLRRGVRTLEAART
jgi:membrane-associated phospholipid phosphatase